MCSWCTRRTFVLGSASIALSTVVKAQPAMPVYCAANLPPPQNLKLHSSCGNPQIDRALIFELKQIATILPINPGYKYIEDPSPNAFAVPTSLIPGTQGTVYIGINLITSEFNNSPFGGVAVAGISAHESGHILQFQTGYAATLAGPTAQLMELHADFLAGYYLGRSQAHSKEHVGIFAQSLFSRGDYDYNGQTHHGTPDQRVRAMNKGYDIGASNLGVSAAASVGANFVRQI
jgi:hypothetical protein